MSRTPPRVAFFDAYPHLYGGGQRTTHLLASSLLARGLTVTVLTTGEGILTRRLSADAVPWSVISLPRALRTYGHGTTGTGALRAAAALPVAWARVARVLARLRPDVVHALDLRGMILAGPAGRLVRAGVVWHVHLSETQPALNRGAAALADRVVIPSAAALGDLVGVHPDVPVIIANAVTPLALSYGPDAQRPERAEDGGRPTVVTSARLSPQKGLDVLIEAIPLIVSEHPGLRVVIFGGAQKGYEGHHHDLLASVEHLGLGEVVRFAGATDAPFAHFAAASVYVQSSRAEIAPLAILEAMAVGLPVVASDVGGVSDLVDDGRTGVLVAPGDPTALAGAVAYLLGNPAQASAFGAAGARRVREHFSLDVMVDRWVSLYESLR
ncbi:MAG: glycosyltransferase family 4 protein [Actinomycetota bacterium]|nr:glycosyltransferase family 4 protein [Actinomycetota bacterium]